MRSSGTLLSEYLRYSWLALTGIFLLCNGFLAQVQAQEVETQRVEEDLPSPKGAFLRSMVMPGWGHYYADNNNWNRGKYHLAGEAVLLLSYFGLDARAGYLENDFITLARSKAGTDLEGRAREYLIAVGNYDNLGAYNDAQLQNRNWDRVYPVTAEYQWSWESTDLRLQYQDTRSRVDRMKAQLPTLVAFMVVNRFISGISAFVQARDRSARIPQAQVTYLRGFEHPGFKATVLVPF